MTIVGELMIGPLDESLRYYLKATLQCIVVARLDKKLTEHDQAIAAILSAIRELMNPPAPKRRPIGFTADLDEKS